MIYLQRYFMKLHAINRYLYPVKDGDIVTEFSTCFFEDILLEAQDDYLAKKYPEVSRDLIIQAIELDRKNAEKLVFGLQQGVIDTLDANSVAAVAELDPLAKQSNKSEADLAFDEAVRRAKSISPKYWQWILTVQKEDPSAEFDEGFFHYLESEGVTDKQLKKLSLEDVQAASNKWHEEQFANQDVGGTYELSPDSPGVTQTGPFFWIPVFPQDAQIEGDKMQNCIGSQCNPSDSVKIFSMRNRFNNPHVSLSVRNDLYGAKGWAVREVKGKQNKHPIPKYIPYVDEFVAGLVKQGIRISPQSDFLRMPVDMNRFVHAIDGDIFQSYNQILDKITDETLNAYVLENGYRHEQDEVISRFTPETVSSLLKHNPINAQEWNSAKFINIAIRHKKISEEQGKELIDDGKMPRGALMTLKSVYHPDAFIVELEKIPVEDLVLSFANYQYGIDGYPGRHPLFTKILSELLERPPGNQQKMTSMFTTMLPKTPFADVLRLFNQTKGQDVSHLILHGMMSSMTDVLIKGDFETRYSILNNIPHNFSIDNKLTAAIVYSTPIGQLKQLYDLGLDSLNEHIKPLLVGLKEIAAEVGSYPSVSGTSQAVIQGADLVLDTDDPDDLRKLRKATKSRGIKKLVDRKLARLQRLTSV